MNIHAGYFEIPTFKTLRRAIDRRCHPFRHHASVPLYGHPMEIRWTDRAERALAARDIPLIAEMQLYFSCVVKKRVLFHDQIELPATPVDGRLSVLFRPVESISCDPDEFARNFPVKRTFESPAAKKLRPSALQIDYRNGSWMGEFFL